MAGETADFKLFPDSLLVGLKGAEVPQGEIPENTITVMFSSTCAL